MIIAMTADIIAPEETALPPHAPAKKKRTRQHLQPIDPWADWKPQWSGKTKKTPHDFQERHSPTENITLRLTGTRETIRGQRRITDARLWEAMNAVQQQAAIEIATAFEMMGRGLGYITSDWTRIPGASGPSSAAEFHSRLINSYINWTRRCHKEKISHSMIIDILVFGFSCRALDKDRRVRNGKSRENLLEGLSLYGTLRGWPS